ncbi:MAG: hypothetical protein H0X66_10670 [Verrucomicrobia bacterium]|nr:hypothetical protein [Verrucomicrobiota bacterium]
MKFNQQRGVALVITLIMLSVITFLAVAFLVLTRRDKAAVNVSLTQTDSRFMADTAMARAEAEIVSRMIATTNMLNYDLLMTRNYIKAEGFSSGETDLLNVNYELQDNGDTKWANEEDKILNIYNLFYDPRPPVYIKTNETGPLDFRFYLDFNRNGRFDTNGPQFVFDVDGNKIGTNVFMWGDPEWIGVLEKPQYRHSPTNRFIGRYLFVALPEGRTLDINFMHNYVKGTAGPMRQDMQEGDGFMRNQGVGSWELNLAAFLEDLNPNLYENAAAYVYRTDINDNNSGGSFDDAFDILKFRYRRDPSNPNSAHAGTLLSAAQIFPQSNNYLQLENDDIDTYSDGPLMSSHLALTNETSGMFYPRDPVSRPWSGSKSTNSYRDVQELFDANKTSPDFVQRLSTMAARSNSFDNQTFARLLSQLGTTSDTNNTYVIAGKAYPKIHLNYDNFTNNPPNLLASQTNFIPWKPLSFFTNAAEALIQKSLIRADAVNHYIGGLPVGTNFNLTNIMVYPTNQYTPTVHRLLQLAANIYSAGTNDFSNGTVTNYPVVFRPQFSRKGTDIFITGYEEVTTDGLTLFEQGFTNLNLSAGRDAIADYPATSDLNVVGVPWVVSAKKGLPNFNELSIETVVQLTRKLELRKPDSDPKTKPNETNQMYVVGITNYIGAEFWNSYTSAFTADIRIRFTNSYVAVLTNEFGVEISRTNSVRPSFSRNPAFIPGALFRTALNPNSFLTTNEGIIFLPESQYINYPSGIPAFTSAKTNAAFERGKGFYVPHWGLTITNQVAAIVEHLQSGRVLDFVNLGNVVTHIDLSKYLITSEEEDSYPLGGGSIFNPNSLWLTNRFGGNQLDKPTEGVYWQLQISQGGGPITEAEVDDLWKNFSPKSGGGDKKKQIDEFLHFLGRTPIYGSKNLTPTNQMESPFNPTRTLYFRHALQANDPLVHYMIADLQDFRRPSEPELLSPPIKSYSQYSKNNLGKINNRYNPWGGKRVPTKNPDAEESVDPETNYELALKDPMVRWSDDWDFPTNKFPNVGWMGRVHRGTPWQTIYLKSRVAETNLWRKWSGSRDTHPTNDWALLDVFSAAPNDNAARGLLSVNQSEIASWSAVLSGVQVLSNSATTFSPTKYPAFAPLQIDPASRQLSSIVDAINAARAARPNQVFESIGDILSAPELTIGTGTNGSPFLFLGDQPGSQQLMHGLNDAAVERIPQQILSLLKVGQPRYVVYSYGQALRPAQNSIVISPPLGSRYLQNICTNYQIAGEVVTKTVLRVEGTPQNPKAVVESFQIISEE